jgi:pullulanase-type alpha-1,6-glucosidase
LRGAIGLLVCIVALLVPAPSAQATHTPIPSVVTLVGSLQSELGCPGDWQPDCTQTELQPVDGSLGLFRATFDVPAADYEYKVALNGSWDENYGAGGAPSGANIPLTAPVVPVTFTYDHATHVISDDAPKKLGAEQGAHWLRDDVIAWQAPAGATSFRLHVAPEGGLTLADGQIAGESFPLEPISGGLDAGLRRQFPHLADYDALRVPRAAQRVRRALLTGQLVTAAYGVDGTVLGASGVQIAGILDQDYGRRAAKDELGPSWRGGKPTLAVWAPTAKDVNLLIDPVGAIGEQRLEMRRFHDGAWRVKGDRSWRNARYAFEVRVYAPRPDEVVTNVVTDPYSLGLTLNSRRSILVELDDPSLEPSGWDRLRKPELEQFEDSAIYELHVRDFSITDETVPAASRGTFMAFTHTDSAGMRHLRDLAEHGLNTLHLLPSNDIATIEEDRDKQEEPACDLASFGPASTEQQACVMAVADRDGFNWGYDPLHYTAPEGSYATDPDGTARTREFREMVNAINGAGLRVVMDVVYNHTPAAGQDPKSILDRIVPGYYQRLSPSTGAVETSTCCQNTATEHVMMGKLMIDSVLTWTKQYKVDGFRFDLMGHQPKALMVELRRALDRLTLARDGVDGKHVYLYGEGWNFGEVANDARFVQATQLNMAGTNIGTFSDRLRDAVRGGGPFDSNPRIQGFATGLYTDPNGDAVNGTTEQQLQRLLHYQDLIKLGLAGNLRDYRFTDSAGQAVKGSEVDYNGQPAGYAADPAETITYVDAHDNETLFDVLQYKLPQATSMADRVRMNTIALATVALGQSPSFWHAGNDILRSKSLDRNSYNSGDWFNRVDWTYHESTWGSGLPPEPDNFAKWEFQRPLLEDPALEPQQADIPTAHARADELLRIRFSSPLFRLGSAPLIQDRVSFAAGGPGVIVMAIDDRDGRDLDGGSEGVVVVFNASDEMTTQTIGSLAGTAFRLHPVQATGGDPMVKQSSYDPASGAFTVPARTVAVFVAG